MIYDANSNIVITNALGSFVLSGGGSEADGDIVDTEGFEGVVAFIRATNGTGSATFNIQEGDLANGNDMQDVPAERITNPPQEIADGEFTKAGFIANKRYVMIQSFGQGAGLNLTISGAFALIPPNQGPVEN